MSVSPECREEEVHVFQSAAAIYLAVCGQLNVRLIGDATNSASYELEAQRECVARAFQIWKREIVFSVYAQDQTLAPHFFKLIGLRRNSALWRRSLERV